VRCVGILYRVAMEAKRNHIIQELLEKGVKHNKEGKSIHDMDYEDLKELLVLTIFRQLDREGESAKWF
jgi:hypothetical protein